jgi:hypothetical protein
LPVEVVESHEINEKRKHRRRPMELFHDGSNEK